VLSEMEQSQKRVLLKVLRHLDRDGNAVVGPNEVFYYILMQHQGAQQFDDPKTAVFDGIMDEMDSVNKPQSAKSSNRSSTDFDEFDDEKSDDLGVDQEAVEREYTTLARYLSSDCNTMDSDDLPIPEDAPTMSASNRSMTVSMFQSIMHQTEKSYDVDSLILELDPRDSGIISLDHIHRFRGPLRSRKSEELMLDSVIQNGLQMVEHIDSLTLSASYMTAD